MADDNNPMDLAQWKCNRQRCELVLKEAQLTVTAQKVILGILVASSFIVVPIAGWLGYRSYRIVENARSASTLIHEILRDLQIDAAIDEARGVIADATFMEDPFERKIMRRKWSAQLEAAQTRLQRLREFSRQAASATQGSDAADLEYLDRRVHAFSCAADVAQALLAQDRRDSAAATFDLLTSLQTYEEKAHEREPGPMQTYRRNDEIIFLWRTAIRGYSNAMLHKQALECAVTATQRHPDSEMLVIDECNERTLVLTSLTDPETRVEEIDHVISDLSKLRDVPLTPDIAYQVHRVEGCLFYIQGNYGKALQCYSDALDVLQPGPSDYRNGCAVNNVAWVRYRFATTNPNGKVDYPALDEAIARWKNIDAAQVAEAKAGLAIALQKLETPRTELAKKYFGEACRLEPAIADATNLKEQHGWSDDEIRLFMKLGDVATTQGD